MTKVYEGLKSGSIEWWVNILSNYKKEQEEKQENISILIENDTTYCLAPAIIMLESILNPDDPDSSDILHEI